MQGTKPPGSLLGEQKYTAIIRMSPAQGVSSTGGSTPLTSGAPKPFPEDDRVQRWINETLAVLEHHTVGEAGRFLDDQGLTPGDDPVNSLDRRLTKLEEIINALRAPDSDRMVPNA